MVRQSIARPTASLPTIPFDVRLFWVSPLPEITMRSQLTRAGFLAAVALAACSSVTTSEPPRVIPVEVTGTVTASDTGDPMVAAVVELIATTTSAVLGDVTTDASGVYVFSFVYNVFPEDNLPFCPFLIAVNVTGYQEGTADLMCTGERETIDIQLMPVTP